MTEVAALSLTAESKTLVVATEELHDLAAAARVAQDAADDMSAASVAGGARVAQFGRAAKVVGASTFAASGGMRMMGLQMSQVVQQAAAGGSVFQELAIQAADIGAMFGGIGVALGIVATIAIPTLMAAFSGLSEQAEEDAKRVKEAWGDMADAVASTQVEIDKLRFGVDEQYQVELLREQLRLRNEISARMVEIQSLAANIASSPAAQAQYLEASNVELQRMADEYNRITAELIKQENRTAQLAIMEGVRTQRANELAARQEEAAAAAANSVRFMGQVTDLYWKASNAANDLRVNTTWANGAASALAGISFGNISLAASWASNLAANLQIAANAAGNPAGKFNDFAKDRAGVGGFGAGFDIPAIPEGGGGGGGLSDRQTALQTLLEELQTEREAVTSWYEEKLALIQTYSDAELEAVGGRHGALERLEAEHLERLKGLQNGYEGDALSNASTFFGEMASAMQSGNDNMLRIAKVFGAAQALINSYIAYTEVLKDPLLPWFARIPAASAVLAAGIGMVNSIKGGGSGGGARTSRSAGTTTAATQTAAPQDVILDFSATANPAMRALAEALLGPLVDQLQKVSKTGVNVVAVRY
jgi:hypothetical protein